MINNLHHTAKIFTILIASALVTGCESAAFYYQAIEGHLSIISKRTPISTVIEHEETSSIVRAKLDLVLSIRDFAEKELLLKTGDHYSQYVALDRPYVVWNVFAAPEFSIKPNTWCYPIAGCVAYKGYFNESDAQKYAEELRNQGLDVYVGGIAAYSTLGWFEDPVLSTFLSRSDPSLAGLLIHELAHQKLYVENDSAFNESFATTVEILGLNSWLTQQSQIENIPIMDQHRARKEQFIQLILAHRKTLKDIYKQRISPEAMRLEKQSATDNLITQYQSIKQNWNGYSGYDRWFNGPLNNAQLSTIGTYHHWVDSFIAIYHQENKDWRRFYERCQEIAQLNRDLRDQTLEKLSVEGRNYRL